MRLSSLLLASLASLFVTITGCAAQLQTTQINPAPSSMRQPRLAADVEIFASGPPSRAHVDVAVIQAKPGIDEHTTGTLIERMRQQAGHMGCDGLVINNVNDQITKNEDITTITATCVAYTGPDPSALTAVAPAPAAPAVAPAPAPAD